MHELPYLVRSAVLDYGLLEENDRVLVACSGGPDSMALFHILKEISSEYALALYLIHLNHGIRKEADEDEAFVRQIASDSGLEIIAGRVDCVTLSKRWKMSLEGAARKARYEFFSAQARNLGVSKIALGHTADDQAETILMRLLRGSGLKGMAGISPVRRRDGVCYIRPLIRCQRPEILKYLSSVNIPFKTDKTNLKPCCTRNRIRLELMPYLKKEFNPSLVNTLSKTAELLREDHLALKEIVSGIEKQIEKGSKKIDTAEDALKILPFIEISGRETQYLHIKDLKAQPLGIQRRILQKSLSRFNQKPGSLHFEHIQAIIRLMNRSEGGGELDLPGGINVYRSGGNLFLTRYGTGREKYLKGRSDEEKGDINHYPLNIPGITFIPFFNLTLNASLLDLNEITEMPTDPKAAFLDYDTITGPFQIRSRFPGDRFHPLGIPAEKKLKEFFIDMKVPRKIRDVWPLLAGGSKIYWVLGLRIGHPYRVTSNTSKILKMDFKITKVSGLDS
ncbi:MAG: tRNA lysidine(34) synthetase TilS [bacterium]